MNVEQTLASSFEDLSTSADNPRQRLSLERIKSACDYLVESGLRISPATVERYCVDRGWEGPKAQSIRNSKDVLMRYLDLRRSGQTVHKQATKGGSLEPDVADESLRAYVQLLKQERDQAVAETNRIKAGLRGIPGVRVDDLLRTKLNRTHTPQLSAPVQVGPAHLQPMQLAAVRAMLDPERLSACGLELYRDRVRQQATRNVLLEKGEVEALRSLLKAQAHG